MPTTKKLLCAALAAVTMIALAACSNGSAATPSAADSAASSAAPEPTATIAAGTDGTVPLGDRPFTLAVPPGYDPAKPVPLVLSLHGYTSYGKGTAGWLGLTGQARAQGFLLAMPDGTLDSQGQRYWNATDGCCDFDGANVDDDAYLTTVITTVQKLYAVDPARIFVIGHSNGGFMALRMACNHSDLVSAAVSVAGEMPADASGCKPGHPVSVLQVQGDADESIHYGGGTGGTGNHYPGALETVADWQSLDQCGATPTQGTADYEASIPGAETTTQAWECADGTEVGLWTTAKGSHVPNLSPQFAPDVTAWMLAHARQG